MIVEAKLEERSSSDAARSTQLFRKKRSFNAN